MKKLLYILLLLPIVVIGGTNKKSFVSEDLLSSYPNFSQSITPSMIHVGGTGYSSGSATIVNDILTINFTSSNSWPIALNTSTQILNFNTSPPLPNMELGDIYYRSSEQNATGYRLKIENNKLIIYSTGQSNLSIGYYFNFTVNLNCVELDGSLISATTKWYNDDDLDGLGNPAVYVVQCNKPAGNYVLDNSDLCPTVYGSSGSCASLTATPRDKNYVRTTNYMVQTINGTSNALTNAALSDVDKAVKIIYFDGLGKPIQEIAGMASPLKKDIVRHIDYDNYNREVRQYLPFVSTTSTLNFDTDAKAKTVLYYNTATFENTTNPYAESALESSPLGRKIEQGAPGTPWKIDTSTDTDHTIKYGYDTNTTHEVLNFKVVFQIISTGGENTENTQLACTGYYPPNQLYKIVTKDENWVNTGDDEQDRNKTTEEFKDKEGHILLKRTYNEGVAHDTYYVYDRYGNLTYVVPPLAADDVVYEVSVLPQSGRNYPWTSLSLVDKTLSDDYNKALADYDNSAILNADLSSKYGGQGGLALLNDGNGNLSLTLNITTAIAMPYRTGIIVGLKELGNFKDKELGRIEGPGYKYIFTIQGNNLFVQGDGGKVPSLNVTLNGQQKLDYSRNYPWTTLCEADTQVIKDYDGAIAVLDNSLILTTYTANPYGAQGGVSMSLDAEDNLSISLNISSATVLELNNGVVFPLDIARRIKDGYLGSVQATGLDYAFYIKDNALVINGSGTFTHLTFTAVRGPGGGSTVTYMVNSDVVDGLCYIYHYDYRNRIIEKHIPDNGWTNIIYDKLDRPIMTQDYNLKAKVKTTPNWLFTKYDKFNRPVYTGQVRDNRNRAAIQSYLNGFADPILNESRVTTGFISGGASIQYSNNAFPYTSLDVFTVKYYDDYNFDLDQMTMETVTWDAIAITTSVKGQLIGSKIRILGQNLWETNLTFYDNKVRPVWTKSKNNYLSSTNLLQSTYDFTGKITHLTAVQYRSSGEIRLDDYYTYDHSGRQLKHSHKINYGVEQLLSFNKYNELGQLTQKKVGGTFVAANSYDNTNALQIVDYSYNIRGWLKGVNDTAQNLSLASATDLFAFKINYNVPVLGSTALYNGNIAETQWKAKSDNKLRNYKYSYDDLNRLTAATYVGNYTLPVYTTQIEKYSEGGIEYDKNGNIQYLERYGLRTNNTTDKIDMLTYTYANYSNKLMSVSDAADIAGFNNSTTGTAVDYGYDSNGNMVKDLNKNIGTVSTNGITYNHLNLPVKITFTGTNKIEYVYTADGRKLQKIVTNGAVTSTQYDSGLQYVDNVLKFFPQEEGFVNKESDGSFSYLYQYKDHLGNIRVSYKDANNNGIISSGEVQEEMNYYPFGMQHKGYNSVISTNNYKYNGKELQDELGLNLYDYGARNYDPALCRWINIDVLAENYMNLSGYSYCINNPLLFIDPTGMAVEEIAGGIRFTGEDAISAFNVLRGRSKNVFIEVVAGKKRRASMNSKDKEAINGPWSFFAVRNLRIGAKMLDVFSDYSLDNLIVSNHGGSDKFKSFFEIGIGGESISDDTSITTSEIKSFNIKKGINLTAGEKEVLSFLNMGNKVKQNGNFIFNFCMTGKGTTGLQTLAELKILLGDRLNVYLPKSLVTVKHGIYESGEAFYPNFTLDTTNDGWIKSTPGTKGSSKIQTIKVTTNSAAPIIIKK